MAELIVRPPESHDVADLREHVANQMRDGLAPQDLPLFDADRVAADIADRLTSRVITGPDGLVSSAPSGRFDAAVLWVDGVHPITGTLERHWQDIVVRGRQPAALRRVLVASLLRARDEGVAVVRAELSDRAADMLADALHDLDFRDHYLISRKQVAACQLDAQCRLSRPEDREFAAECLTAAICNGLDEQVEISVVGTYVDRHLSTYDQDQLLSIVAQDEHGHAAHAAVRLVRSRFGADHEASLLDIFVPESRRGQGWARRLGSHVEHYLHERGVTRLEGSVVTGHRPPDPALMTNLAANGWWLDRRSMRLQLANRISGNSAGP